MLGTLNKAVRKIGIATKMIGKGSTEEIYLLRRFTCLLSTQKITPRG
jgi:hypothetical protein